MRANMKCHLAVSRHDLTSIPCYRWVNRQNKNKQLDDFSAAKRVNKGAGRCVFSFFSCASGCVAITIIPAVGSLTF